MKDSSTLYDTFNARYLSFTEVAEGFISNEHFDELLSNGHTLLMGPRGCGKTTLLKMLYPAALLSYDNRVSQKLFYSIPFWGVYIPTDVQWKKQIEQAAKRIEDSKIVDIISRGTVTINILQSLCKTFSFLIQTIGGEDTIIREYELCKKIIHAWGIEGPISPTLKSIELALLKIVSDLNAGIRYTSIFGGIPNIDKIFYYDYFDLVNIACEAFENDISSTKVRWALCFDELEIAPEWLRNDLLGNLRSRNQRIIFKLTTAPIISFYKNIDIHDISNNATENNDFKVAKIWTSNPKEFKSWFKFCDKLLNIKLKRKFGDQYDPSELFGTSDMDRLIVADSNNRFDAGKHNYELGTPSYFAFQQLAKSDRSFSEFLIRKKIDPSNPIPHGPNQKDQIFRKIKQLVIYRLEIKNAKMGLRSRKVVPFYYGLPLLYEVSDGNPRVLISIIDELLSSIKTDKRKPNLSINEQSRIIHNISETYLNVISSHPDASIKLNNRSYNLKELLIRIGNFFFQSLANEPFSMDPIGSFKVDAEVNSKVIPLLELALYLGAIVYLDNVDVLSEEGIVNKRFRLSYSLAPYFSLLARDNVATPLSNILYRNKRNQNQLFENNED